MSRPPRSRIVRPERLRPDAVEPDAADGSEDAGLGEVAGAVQPAEPPPDGVRVDLWGDERAQRRAGGRAERPRGANERTVAGR